ncbi:uncharacterized protein BX664DRAFT_282174 [Halteromyces radiatus]|uniref:uncharacterized protein n=1 Tax=Halteromyces radiatus TaxID=101107 RepID=UPI00222029FF|nr:uncharacterized protein BX664DRAFT_282174 [Halteromyces radiatus]KAI8086338.1 hypothetical protein BX664DRAFT_282174 [Halteromyces radiatus]
MLEDSRLPSLDSTCSSHEGLDHLVLPQTSDMLLPNTTAILQTQDDISSDSECSSTDGHDQALYDLPLVIRALKTTLKHQEEQQEQQQRQDEGHSSEDGQSCLDTPPASLEDDDDLDERQIHTPTTSTCSTSSDLKPIDTTIHSDPSSNPTKLANGIQLPTVDPKSISPNLMNAIEQEKQDETANMAMHYFFQNQFMKAKQLLEQHAASNPLHSLCLSSMLFLKAVMTNDERTRKESLDALLRTYHLTTTELEMTVKQQSAFFGHPVLQYAQHCYYYLTCGNHHLASHPTPRRHRQLNPFSSQQQKGEQFVSNGILRAHIIKAESCLQMAILYLLQGSYSSYIKCGINIRRAYASYYFVWQEQQRMGQFHANHIDKNTLCGLQFGIGAVHLILDSLPLNIRRIVSSFTWQPEKQLGLALLRLSKESDGIRSPWSSLLLLAYYTILTSSCPQILMVEYSQPAIEVLLEAQQAYPHSAFFLHFAGRTSRIGCNIPLSTQSFLYAIEISKSDWAELDIFHVCSNEIGFNSMMQMDWEEAIKVFELLYEHDYWSNGVFRYLHGTCLAMLGLDTEAILLFAQVPELILHGDTASNNLQDLEKYILQKVRFFESTGYQDCRLSLCALEYVCLMNGICFLDSTTLEHYLVLIDDTLQHIVEMEQLEFAIREREMDPDTPLPCYVNQRAVLLWMKACIYNKEERYDDAIPHLNWIVDHKDDIDMDQWVIPFTFWEAGITAWNMDNRTRGRELWEKAATYKNYAFENRMALKIHLTLSKADADGVPSSQKINNYQGRSRFKSIILSS